MVDLITPTAQHWSEHSARFSARNAGIFWWEAGPEIRKYINSKISGDPKVDWAQYTLQKYFGDRLPLVQCLSLGCGNGHFERALARLGAFQQCDAYDVAEGSIQMARAMAKAEGVDNIVYHVADVNQLRLRAGLYDAVWVNAAMHHFEALEHICREIKQSLKPRGLLILNEYVGPNRFQCSPRQKQIANNCLQLLPAKYRTLMKEQVALELERTPFEKGLKWFAKRLIDKAKEGDLAGVIVRRFRMYKARFSDKAPIKSAVDFPMSSSVIAIDPSEAIRSADIIEVLLRDFVIIERRNWGGNVLQFLLAGIAGNFSDEDPDSQALLQMLINIEDTLLKCGEFDSDFTYIVARPIALCGDTRFVMSEN